MLTTHPNGKYPKDKKEPQKMFKTIFGGLIAYDVVIRVYVNINRNNRIKIIKEIHLCRISHDTNIKGAINIKYFITHSNFKI
jgi:hypothetical protein